MALGSLSPCQQGWGHFMISSIPLELVVFCASHRVLPIREGFLVLASFHRGKLFLLFPPFWSQSPSSDKGTLCVLSTVVDTA